MSDILSHLLESENFDLILEEYELSKYELLSSIREEVIRHPEKFSPDEKEQLKGFYLSNYSMIDLHSEPVIFISDTHYASKNENLIYTENWNSETFNLYNELGLTWGQYEGVFDTNILPEVIIQYFENRNEKDK